MRKMSISKHLYRALGITCVGLAYVGLVTPGIPFSIFLIVAAWAFAKSSESWHNWIYSHPVFGNFLRNWNEKRIFPTRGKILMIVTMSTTLAITWFSTMSYPAVIWSGSFMLLVAVWALKYPGTEAEYNRRKSNNLRIGWIR
jgi:uncharacterized membrane protein YbaN (DUF454 family)